MRDCYLWAVYENYRNRTHFWGYFLPRLKLCINFWQKYVGLGTFWALFSQTHLVTLVLSHLSNQALSPSASSHPTQRAEAPVWAEARDAAYSRRRRLRGLMSWDRCGSAADGIQLDWADANWLLAADTWGQGCQMVFFQTQTPNLAKFWWALELKMLEFLWPFWIWYVHLVYFMAVSYCLWSLGIFFKFGPRKIWQPCLGQFFAHIYIKVCA
jgi:hypothetical protein